MFRKVPGLPLHVIIRSKARHDPTLKSRLASTLQLITEAVHNEYAKDTTQG
jgi:hypothetical protein